MTNRFASIIALLIYSAAVGTTAEPPASEDREGLRDDATLRSVFFVDAAQGWACGDRGVIWYTPDGGRHWISQESGVGCRLDCIHFANTREGWAVGGWYEPETQLSRGVVLKTEDGGRSWTQLPTDVPRLRSIQFRDRREGIAVGDWSSVHVSSVLLTYDGGQSWQPAPQSQATGTHRLSLAGEAILTIDREGHQWRADRSVAPAVGIQNDHRVSDICGSPGVQFAVGKDGLMLFSRDGGRRWGQIPPANTHNANDYDLRCVTEYGGTCWMAGLPGDQVFQCSSDGVVSSAPTGYTAAINDIHFADSSHGWAVCEFGTILATTDGGHTWRPQRGGRRHAAALMVSQEVADLPWPLVIAESIELGYRCVAVAEPRTPENDPCEIGAADLGAQAFSQLGGSDLIALPRDLQDAPYRREIAKVLRSTQPVAVILSNDLSESKRSAWIEATTNMQSIKRVFSLSEGTRGDVVRHSSAILPAAGAVIGDAWREAISLVSPGRITADSIVANRLLDRDQIMRPLESLLHGLPLGAGGEARRMPPSGSRTALTRLQPRGRYADWIDQLIETSAVSATGNRLFISRLDQLIDQILPSDKPLFLERLVAACRLKNRPALYRLTLRKAIVEIPDTPLGRWTDAKTLAIDASQEWARLVTAESIEAREIATADARVRASYGSPFEKDQPVRRVAASSNSSKRTIRRSQSFDLLWRYHPANLLSQSAVLANTAGSDANTDIKRLSVATSSGAWQALALSELAIRERKPILDAIPAPFAAAPPRLDARLDESIWTSERKSLPDDEPQVQVAFDSQYVYFAIRNAFPEIQESLVPLRRERDADLDQSDRISLQIDVDRDLMTSYRLEIDERGRLRDTVDGFTGWQPMWAVKTDVVDKHWTAEIAIRRADLFDLPIVPGDGWRVKLQRISKGEACVDAARSSAMGWETVIFKE